eukprot:TRINITY_DN1333_c0_g1_i2.p1 TRINITY_DN1333_c0_g1~~TRINITY_DN1333_c0_g1_i2.p1  ORF type:complete len:735 (+),score=316.48 TRINITY_DN1333_c0_g1_i2:75-2207(+)
MAARVRPAKLPPRRGVNYLTQPAAASGAAEEVKPKEEPLLKVKEEAGLEHKAPDLKVPELRVTLKIKKEAGQPMGLLWSNSFSALTGVKKGSVADLAGAQCLLRMKLVSASVFDTAGVEAKVDGSAEALKAIATPLCRQSTKVRLVFEPCPDLPIKPEEGVFEPSENYLGPKPGWYYGTTGKGTGYHKDPKGAGRPKPAAPAPKQQVKAPSMPPPAAKKEQAAPAKAAAPAAAGPADAAARTGKEFTLYRERAEEPMGFGFNPDMTLARVVKGSPADMAGLEEVMGWKLVEVEGKQVKRLADCGGLASSMVMKLYLEPDEEVATLDEADILLITKRPTTEDGRGFQPALRFIGKKKGMYFAREEHGLGYYKDPKFDPEKERKREKEEERKRAQERLKQLQAEMREKMLPATTVAMSDSMSEVRSEEERKALKEYEDALMEVQDVLAKHKVVKKRAQCLPAPPGFKPEDGDGSGGMLIKVVRKDAEELVGWDFDDDVRIRSVKKKSPASRAGLDGYLNWKLTKLNGVDVNSFEDLAGHEGTLEFEVYIQPPKHVGVKAAEEVIEKAVDALEYAKERDGEVTSMRCILEATEKDQDGKWVVKIKEDILKGASPERVEKLAILEPPPEVDGSYEPSSSTSTRGSRRRRFSRSPSSPRARRRRSRSRSTPRRRRDSRSRTPRKRRRSSDTPPGKRRREERREKRGRKEKRRESD